ncbi:MAG: LuxR C-terminal-related transcriptional regulator [Nitriliruptoraceae bacterium]
MDPPSALVGDLVTTWRACAAGASAVRVLVGPAGIGKSTILSTLAADVGERAIGLRCQGGALAPAGSTAASLLAALGADATGGDTGDPLPLADRLEAALLSATGDGPLAVLIDDLHEADPVSGIALGLAARRARVSGLLLVAVSRPSQEVLRLTEGLPLRDVAPLDEDASRALLLASSEHPIDDAVTERLLAVAQGSPLALTRLPQLFRAEELSGSAPLPRPLPLDGDLRAVFSGQIARLSEPARALLEAAAVSEHGDWAAICRCTDVDVEAGLDDLLRQGVATVTGGRFRPSHPLLLEAAVAHLDPSNRRRLERCFAEDPHLPPASRLLHRARAAVSPDPALGRDLATAAATLLGEGGGELAGRLLDVALTHANEPSERWSLLLRSAEAYGLSGDPATARARLATVVEEAPLDPVGILASIPLAAMESLSGSPRRGVQRLLECAQAASPELAVPIALAQPIPLGMLGDVPAIVRATSTVVDALPVGSAEHAAATIIHSHGLFALDEAAALAGLPEKVEGAAIAAGLALDPSFGLHVGRALGYAERYDDAEQALLSVIARARATRARSSLAMAFGALADVRLRSGRFDDARDALDEAITLSLGIGQRAFAPFWLGMRARIDAIRGDDPDADLGLGVAIAESLDLTGALYYLWSHAGNVALSLGRPRQAIVELERCRRFEAGIGVLTAQVSRWRVDLVDAYTQVGDHDEAREVLAELNSAPVTHATRWSRAAILWMHGMVEADRDPVAAAGSFDQALALLDPRIDRFDTARLHAHRAPAARRLGDEVAGERATEQALAGFEALGASRWAAQVQGRPGAGGRTGQDPLGVLTPAERRILDHVARGLTNQQVATRLGVSARTVANHLYRSYQKLGVASRTEAALLVAAEARLGA